MSKARHYFVLNGILYKKNRRNFQRPFRVVKPAEVATILYNFHEDPLAGHFGFQETFRSISMKYYWPDMGKDIKAYVQSCDTCQKRKRPMKTESLHPLKVGQPFDRLGMDIVGPLPATRNSNKYIVVATEYLTKWPEAQALPDAKAASVVSFFYEDIICRHGCPRELLTDQGTHFVNALLDALCDRLGVKHRLSTAYHPQTNGLVERFNRTLCEILAKYASQYQQDWDLFLPSALFAYRTIRQNTTRYEPFYLTYGRDAILPIDLMLPSSPPPVEQDFESLYFERLQLLMGQVATDRLQAQRNIEQSQVRQVQRHEQRLTNHQY
jgi:hypothetical protein